MDVDTTCRTCLTIDDKLLPISSNIESDRRIIDYFENYMHIKMYESDYLPMNICMKCLDRLLEVRKFSIQCNDSENYLRLKFGVSLIKQFIPIEVKSIKQPDIIEEVEVPSEVQEDEVYEIVSDALLIKEENLEAEYLEVECEESNLDGSRRENEISPLQFTIKENELSDEEEIIVSSEDFAHFDIIEEYTSDDRVEDKCEDQVEGKCDDQGEEKCDDQVEDKCDDQVEDIYNDVTKGLTDDENVIAVIEINTFQCDKCYENFKYIKNLQYHKKLFHAPEKENIIIDGDLYEGTRRLKEISNKCKYCECSFVFESNLEKHIRRHTARKKFINDSCVCSECGKVFEDKRKLQKHLYRHKSTNLSLPCPICKKIFKAKPNLQVHMIKHTGETPFECNICNKTFASPSSLRLHKTLHEGKTIQCPMCDQKLAAKTQLKMHMRMHTNERPYVCDQCPKSYKQLCALKTHTATHSSVKTVQCTRCDSLFHTKNHLHSHMLKMHWPKRFHCTLCTLHCSTPFQMRTHLLAVHKLKVQDLSPYRVNNSKVDSK